VGWLAVDGDDLELLYMNKKAGGVYSCSNGFDVSFAHDWDEAVSPTLKRGNCSSADGCAHCKVIVLAYISIFKSIYTSSNASLLRRNNWQHNIVLVAPTKVQIVQPTKDLFTPIFRMVVPENPGALRVTTAHLQH
jgi:hypothetical protein